ncbi:MAG TPA: amidohydrolase [Gemmatimonadaceae bacterium]|nr:amidohydrolase [Gemmatimonadaceae bacterium]
MRRITLIALTLAIAPTLRAQNVSRLHSEIDRRARELESKVVAWRRDFHQNPELGNREFRTSKIVAEHLQTLGIEVKTGVAHTGVVGVLKGGRPGPVVALRADMDALPVTEEVDLPFKSTAKTQYNGQEVGVMHACGHDNHVAILMGVAEMLAGMKAELPGTVKFIFQPAEEGPPLGEKGGAPMMLEEGAFTNPKVDAVFGLHVFPNELGQVEYKTGGLMASSDNFYITVKGRQTHGALPWNGVDPIVTASQVVLGIQTLISRQTDLTLTPAVVTVGMMRGGIRTNIVPDSVEMAGTIRTFDEGVRAQLHERLTKLAESIATANGATASVRIQKMTPVTYNDPPLTERMVPTLERVLGKSNVKLARPTTTAEDFSFFQQAAPGMFFFIGVTPKDRVGQAAPNHSPKFFADEGVLVPGMRAMANLAIDFLSAPRP